jgi:hypothetical protein
MPQIDEEIVRIDRFTEWRPHRDSNPGFSLESPDMDQRFTLENTDEFSDPAVSACTGRAPETSTRVRFALIPRSAELSYTSGMRLLLVMSLVLLSACGGVLPTSPTAPTISPVAAANGPMTTPTVVAAAVVVPTFVAQIQSSAFADDLWIVPVCPNMQFPEGCVDVRPIHYVTWSGYASIDGATLPALVQFVCDTNNVHTLPAIRGLTAASCAFSKVGTYQLQLRVTGTDGRVWTDSREVRVH